MVKTLTKHGNSQALVIDKALIEEMGIDESTPLQITVQGGRMIICPVQSSAQEPDYVASVEKVMRERDGLLKRLA